MKPGPNFFGLTIGFLVLSIIFLVIERVLGTKRGKPWFRKGWGVDAMYWFFTPLVSKGLSKAAVILPVVLLIALGVLSVPEIKAGNFHGFGPLSRQPIWLQVIEIYLLSDIISYWTHRLFHTGKWWPFHAVHHCSEDLDWMSSVRLHPVNDLVSKFCQVTPLLLLGFNSIATLSAAPFFTFYAILLHADVNWDLGPLRGIIASPVFHRWHHSKDREAWDKNFAGLFAFIDRIFGTYYMPKGRYPENFGVTEEFPQGLVGQMIEPFARLFGRRVVVESAADLQVMQPDTVGAAEQKPA
jgi:sterol desaturase/sphingolipid hydroxylase (fatty acid hydroxylase superfamily)